MVKCRMLAATVALALAGLASVTSAGANEADPGSGGGVFAPGYYTHSPGSCTTDNRVDPVNIFFDRYGLVDQVANHILAHADWEWPGGSDQYFANGGDCNDMTSQVASGTIIQGRFHTRLYQTPGYDLAFMWTVTGDAHFEYFCDFTHSVWGNDSIYGSGFDYAKYMLQYDMGMADEHTTTWWYWGNSQHMHQHCDQGGDYAWSDGWTAEIDMPYWYH